MPKIEVDEEDFRASAALRQTVEGWMKNPAARRKLLEARKAADPKAEIPELDSPDPVQEKFATLETTIADMKKATADAEAKRDSDSKLRELEGNIEKGIAALRREHRLTDDGVTELRKIMETEGIIKPEIAWAVHQQRHPPQNPITPNGTGAWGFMDAPTEGTEAADDIKALLASKGEDNAILRKMTNKALADIRAA